MKRMIFERLSSFGGGVRYAPPLAGSEEAGAARRCSARVRLGFWSSGLSAYRLVPVRGSAQVNISRAEISL